MPTAPYAYLSHPMTKATTDEKQFHADFAKRLRENGIPIYDPTDEPKNMTMRQTQNYDFRKLGKAKFMVMLWTETAPDSRGVNAELEWAVRCFNLPILLVTWSGYSQIQLELWPHATLLQAPLFRITYFGELSSQTIKILRSWLKRRSNAVPSLKRRSA